MRCTDVLTVSHRTPLDGPIDFYAEHLRARGRDVASLSHPLDAYGGRDSVLAVDDAADVVWRRRELGLVNLALDALLTLMVLRGSSPSHIVAANNFDTLCALLFRACTRGRRPRIVYFASDYSPQRYNSLLLDRVYLAIERVCLQHADVVVSNTRRAHEARRALGLPPERGLVVPNGASARGGAALPAQRAVTEFVYVGSVTKEHGVLPMIEVLAASCTRLVLIGDGADWDAVVARCEELGVPLELHRAKPHSYVLDFLSSFRGFGLAPYTADSEWTWYCSPVKVVEYVTQGVPVIMSSVPEIAAAIVEHGVGIVYEGQPTAALLTEVRAFDATRWVSGARTFAAAYDRDALLQQIPC